MPVKLAEGSEFILKLNGIKLPAAAEARIGNELRTALLREVAQLDLKADFSTRIPKEWLGIWLEKLDREKLPRLAVKEF